LASGRLLLLLALEVAPQGGRPPIETELRVLIRRMSVENALWGAPRIHGELLKLGFKIAQSSVAKYMVKRRGPPSQGWRTFLRNHAQDIAAMDLFVVPTIGFELLYGFVIVRIDRRDLVWINVTTNPTAEWIARQITEAFPWDGAPRYMIRDRDRTYGAVVTRRLRAMGIRDKPTAPASPWQNGFAERLIGSIRRECLDHIIVSGEAHLRRVLKSYARYYNGFRTHRSLNKDAPVSRPVQRSGFISSHAILGGLHHRYARVLVFGTHRPGRHQNLAIAPGLALNNQFREVSPEYPTFSLLVTESNRLARPELGFRRFSEVEISDVYSAYKEMLSKWQHVPVGGKLHLNW
jgi:transposase InsO family protein